MTSLVLALNTASTPSNAQQIYINGDAISTYAYCFGVRKAYLEDMRSLGLDDALRSELGLKRVEEKQEVAGRYLLSKNNISLEITNVIMIAMADGVGSQRRCARHMKSCVKSNLNQDLAVDIKPGGWRTCKESSEFCKRAAKCDEVVAP